MQPAVPWAATVLQWLDSEWPSLLPVARHPELTGFRFWIAQHVVAATTQQELNGRAAQFAVTGLRAVATAHQRLQHLDHHHDTTATAIGRKRMLLVRPDQLVGSAAATPSLRYVGADGNPRAIDPALHSSYPTLEADPAWLAQCDKHHAESQQRIEMLVLGGPSSSSSTSSSASAPKRLENLERLLRPFGLLPQQGQPGPDPNDGDDDGAVLLGGDDDVEAGPSSSSGGGGRGVGLCMLDKAARNLVLVQAAVASVCPPAAATAGPPPAAAAAEGITLVAALASADPNTPYRFPVEKKSTARKLLVRLSDAGLVFPLRVADQEMFLIHPALRSCLLPRRRGGQPRHRAEGDTLVAATTVRGAGGNEQGGAGVGGEDDDDDDGVLCILHEEHAGSNEGTRPRQSRRRGGGGASALQELERLGQTRDINALSKHARQPPTAASIDGGGVQTHNNHENSGGGAAAADVVVTETNFRLYLYLRPLAAPLAAASFGDVDAVRAALHPESATLLRLLEQFASLDVLVPRFAVLRLTRSRFVQAVRRGVTQRQILTFLGSHAPLQTQAAAAAWQTPRNGSELLRRPIPQSIADQLGLWEREARRVQLQSRVVLVDCPHSVAASRVEQLVASAGAAFTARRGLQMCVTQEVYERVLRPHMAR